MRRIQVVGAVLLVVGLLMLYFLRRPLVALVLLVLEFLAIVVALVFVIVGIAMLLGSHWVRRRFWMRT